MKRFYLTILLTMLLWVLPKLVYGGAKVITPLPTQSDYLTAHAVAGKAPNGDIVPLSLDAAGNLTITVTEAAAAPTMNFVTVIPQNGPVDRTQLPSHTVRQCLIQAPLTNSGMVYLGGVTVTNASGVNEGLGLIQGDVGGPFPAADTNEFYVTADHIGDKVKVFCK